jgi:hypothetical protein
MSLFQYLYFFVEGTVYLVEENSLDFFVGDYDEIGFVQLAFTAARQLSIDTGGAVHYTSSGEIISQKILFDIEASCN